MASEQGGRTGDDDAMGVAESDIGPHGDKFIGKEHPGFVHPVVDERGTFGLSGQNYKGAHKIGGETRPNVGLEFLT